MDLLTKLKTIYPTNNWRIGVLFSAFVFSGLTLLVTILHYQNKLTANSSLWIFWLLSMITFMLAYLPSLPKIKNYWCYSNNKYKYLIFIFTTVCYSLVHVVTYITSSLNNYSLNDDAAWDIHFAKKWILLGEGFFQPVFLDTVISRESLFHYYIITLFKLFGYNIFTFNMGLLFLGFITILFTALTIHTLFNRWWITTLGIVILLIFPLYVTQTFIGHRYAIAMPTIMISYYYLASGFKNRSPIQACIGGIFIGLSLCGAPMGKQYLLALILMIPCSIIFSSNKKVLIKRNFPLLSISFIALIISVIPLICYIHYNWIMYFNREKGLLVGEILNEYQTHGLSAITNRAIHLMQAFFSPTEKYRRFMYDYPLIPYTYWILLVPGMLITVYKKRLEILIMCLLPAFIGFLTEPWDFRIQISTPFWIISILYAISSIADHAHLKRNKTSLLLATIAMLSISIGLVSSSIFTSKAYLPYYIVGGPMDVAFLRVTQDLARGNEIFPSIEMKNDEFNPIIDINDIEHNTLVCPINAFAVMYLFLQNFDEDQSMSLCDGLNSRLLGTPEKILSANLKALSEYKDNNKDLMLVWQLSDNTKPVVKLFNQFQKYGYSTSYYDKIDRDEIVTGMLKIKKENVGKFLSEVKSISLSQ